MSICQNALMNLYTRIGMFSFIIGALLSVLDGAFIASQEMRGLIYVLLIFFGLFAGILNVTEDEEHHFLLSAGAFLLVVLSFNMLFAGETVLVILTRFFQNAVAFVGSMALVVAIKVILEFGSQNYRVSPVENMEARTEGIDDWEISKKLKVWHFIVFLAVAVTFIVILLGLPIYSIPQGVHDALLIIEWVVIAIFIIDLVVLFKHEESFGSFLRNCWVDIIAAIPVPGIFGAVKIIRVARIARVARLGRVTHSLKFFSKKSGVNTYLRKGQRRVEPIEIKEHPVTEQKQHHRKAPRPVRKPAKKARKR